MFAYRLIELNSLAARADKIGSRTTETVSMQNEGRHLAGTLYTPPATPVGYIVLAHGNRQTGKDHQLYRHLSAILSEQFVVLSFDFRGYGESEAVGGSSKAITLDFSSDVVAAVEFVANRFSIDNERVILIGHSFGAMNVILAGKQLGTERVIAVGAGAAEVHLDDATWEEYQRKKLSRIGLQVPAERMAGLYRPLSARHVLSGSLPRSLTFVWASSENGLRELQPHLDAINSEATRIRIISIPLSDHMYWSEGNKSWSSQVASALLGTDASESALGRALLESLQSGAE